MNHAMTFAGSPLDRSSNERRDEAWLDNHLSAKDSRYLPLLSLKVLANRQEHSLGWCGPAEVIASVPHFEPYLLGVRDGIGHFAVDVSEATADGLALMQGDTGTEFSELRRLAPGLSEGDAAICAYARSLINYHQRNRFCANCGAPTQARAGGAARSCTHCQAEHFPRTDPVAIALVLHSDRCLLGRSGRFAGKLYSALAGFIEPGESIEEAVRREVKEESGIDVGEVRYLKSQPWPFPSSLMIGCLADATSDEITVDTEELADAQWFSKADVRRALAGEDMPFSLPQPLAVANHLIRAWALEDS